MSELTLIQEVAKEMLGSAPRCADCTSYPRHWPDMARFCPSIQQRVEFLTPACPLQQDRAREQSPELVLEKMSRAAAPLTHLTRRLDDLVQRRNPAALPVYPGFPVPIVPHLEVYGTVYFVECGPYTKIGFTALSIQERMTSLAGSNPYPLTVYATIPGPTRLERYLHSEFAAWRHRFEWFKFDGKARTKANELIRRYGGHIVGEEEARDVA